MKLLITGGCGFLGSNLAAYGIINGYDITVLDNLSRLNTDKNLLWLKSLGNVSFIHGDIRNRIDLENTISSKEFDAVFHLAGQVAMTTSLEYPYKDFEVNALGTINLLETIRKLSPNTSVIYSSTNKVYGDLEQYEYEETQYRYICTLFPKGFPESVPLDFRSPYGCSKGSADQYILDYHRMFGLKTIVFRHSSMYGSRQFATFDQGWIGWFCQKAVEKHFKINNEPFTISGNGKQVRDILHVEDMINLYYTSLNNLEKACGNAYNIGGGSEQSLSLLELFNILEDLLDVRLEYIQLAPRQSDQKVFIADISKITNHIGWSPKVSSTEGIAKMVNWIKELYI